MKLVIGHWSLVIENFIKPANYLKEAAGVFWRKITEDKISFILSTVSLLFFLFSIFYFLFSIDNLPSEAPLFYSKIWGEKRLAPVKTLWLLPGLGLGLWLFNIIMAVKIFREKNFTRLLFFYQTVIGALLTLALVKIILLISFI